MGDEPDFRGSTKEKGNYKRCPGGREGGWQGRVSANEEGAGRNILLSQRWGNNGLSRLLNRADPLKLRWKKRKEGMAFARIRNMFPAICVAFPRDIEINLGSVFFCSETVWPDPASNYQLADLCVRAFLLLVPCCAPPPGQGRREGGSCSHLAGLVLRLD